MDFFPPSETLNIRTNDVIFSLVEHTSDNKAYSDLTGRFPFQSTRGNNYIMVTYHVDANVFLVEPVKNRGATTLLNAWQKSFNRLHKAGLRPNAWILDNECSTQLKDAIHKIQ